MLRLLLVEDTEVNDSADDATELSSESSTAAALPVEFSLRAGGC